MTNDPSGKQFGNIAVAGQSTVIPTNGNDTITLAGSGVTITTDPAAKTVTFAASGPTLTGPVTSVGNATSAKSAIPFFQTAGANGTYTLCGRMPWGGIIDSATCKTVSGTATAAIKINGTSVASLSAVAVSSTPATTASSGTNTFATADIVTIVISASSTPVGLDITVNLTGNSA